MIQLDNRKKIIIGVIIFLIILLVIIFVFKNNNKNVQVINPSNSNQTTEVKKTRAMTQDEKINVVGIDPSQEAEVINDQNGLYIYRIKK